MGMDIRVGDKVRFLNDVGGGTVSRIMDRMRVMVMNEYGFEVPSQINELVVIESGNDYTDVNTESEVKVAQKQNETGQEIVVDTDDIFYPDVAIDDSLGNNINLLLAFVPKGRPGNSDLDVFFINDSNYNLLYSIINVDKEGKAFSNAAGVLEANTKEQIETLALQSVNDLPAFVFHILFYRKGEFSLKQPMVKEITINPVRFYKEKAYTENDFFNEDSLMVPVYTDSVLVKEVDNLSESDIKKMIKEKEKPEIKQEYSSRKEKEKVLLEVDLHIHELLDDFRGLTNSEILEVQMDHFKSKLLEAQHKNIKKVVFIHGVGNGTLKSEIRKELESKKKMLTFQDASFKEYGYGATLVHFK